MIIWLLSCSGADKNEVNLDSASAETEEFIPPVSLEHWLTGNAEDVQVHPDFGVLLIGGGVEPDEGFVWWNSLINNGDVVVLRATGSDGYNTYIHTQIGGVDSVETLKVDSHRLANDDYIVQQVSRAEGIFIAGGDQWDYLSLWKDTGLHQVLREHIRQNKPIGGSSAGLAILGEWIFSASQGTVYSAEVLENPYNSYVQLHGDFLEIEALSGVIADSHFSERERLGRLIGFVGRLRAEGHHAVGWGIDESTALLWDKEYLSVVGSGSVFFIEPEDNPQQCIPEAPLEWEAIPIRIWSATGQQRIEYWSARDGILMHEQ